MLKSRNNKERIKKGRSNKFDFFIITALAKFSSNCKSTCFSIWKCQKVLYFLTTLPWASVFDCEVDIFSILRWIQRAQRADFRSFCSRWRWKQHSIICIDMLTRQLYAKPSGINGEALLKNLNYPEMLFLF